MKLTVKLNNLIIERTPLLFNLFRCLYIKNMCGKSCVLKKNVRLLCNLRETPLDFHF
ncbi:conserved domain protein [Bacteroides clarus YIT 12056]|uniref:Conserved domain protein n=1 Tax=Bacteroides clarus YIT 12056 TaxID=762984 RepID=A0ABP2KT04_9BACE|nr:conserved domain protein [Bacteroides clarus YIT 12056]